MVHRDIKPANILIHNYMAKIADFGFSKLINENNEMLFSIVGTP
jgi:serine/threonine-protein kinase ULK/ATG1